MNAETKKTVVEGIVVEDPVEDSTEIEVVDGAPEEAKKEEFSINDEELEAYVSKKVQKRFDTLTYEKHEERRGKEAAEGLRDQAVEFARQQVQRSQQYENLLNTGEAHLVEQFKARAAKSVELSKTRYREAYDSGDTDAIVKAQEELIQSQSERQEAFRYENDYKQRSQQFANQQQYRQHIAAQQAAQPPAPQTAPARPTVKATAWGEENPWFTDKNHPEMVSLAYGIDQRLCAEGVQRDSDQYYQEIDNTMRQRFPDYEGFKTTPSTVVAPVKHNIGVGSRKVTLSVDERGLADRLGISYEQYAIEKLKGAQADKR